MTGLMKFARGASSRAGMVALTISLCGLFGASGCGAGDETTDVSSSPDSTGTTDAGGADSSTLTDGGMTWTDTSLPDTTIQDAAIETDSVGPSDAATLVDVSDIGASADSALIDASVSDGSSADSTADAQSGLMDGGIPDGADDADGSQDDAGPQTCFYNSPPGPDANVADVPQPNFATCTQPAPAFFKAGETVGKPSLKVEIGTHDPVTGAFVPYVDDQWLPMFHGPQGGFHVYLATRVTLPNESAATVKLQAESLGYAGCNLAAKGNQPVQYANVDKSAPKAYATSTKTSAGTLVIFPAPSGLSHLYCGIWLELVTRVRKVGSPIWGEANLTVRLYDNK